MTLGIKTIAIVAKIQVSLQVERVIRLSCEEIVTLFNKLFKDTKKSIIYFQGIFPSSFILLLSLGKQIRNGNPIKNRSQG